MALDRIRDVSLKLLCSQGGCMQYSTLRRELCQVLQVTDWELCRMLRASQCFAIVPGQGSKRAGSELSEDSQLIATTSVRLCKDFLKKNCSGSCSQIHLCKFFLLGNCKFSKGRHACNFSHAIHSPHNLSVLSSIAKLTEAELRQLLLQNDTSLLPEICTFYNKGPGRYGSCTYKQECTKLHVCLHYVQGSCKFGSSCKRCHSFSDSNSAMTLENLRADVAHNLLQTYQNLYSIKNYTPHNGKATEKSPRSRQSSGSSSGDLDSEEICLYFVRKNCSFKDQCNRVHFKLPYRWQIHGESWQDLLNMEQIEKDYCDPSKTRSSVINFEAMVSGLSQIRRLSTASSVTKPPHYILTTEWLWYWKDEYGKWIEYGKQEGLHSAASTTSINLEKAYLADSNGKVEFTAGKHQYVLSFKEMCQTNMHIGTQRAVRRRPKFISEKDLENQIQNQGKPGQSGNTRGKSIPANWDKPLDVDMEYKLVRVLESSEEYKQVQTLFQRTMRNSVIQKIERVQNLALWEVFQWQKEQMRKASGGADVVEKQLFHGTDPKFIEAICQQNFDWRICGVHGTAYGRGTYFARDASYSHNYCQPRQGAMTMFVARVLVGQFVKGDSSYLRPPLRDGSKSSYYDSCVNDVSNPSIFVIFEKHQIYPEYVIDYKS